MPIYVYKCDKCSNQFELKQGFDAESTQPCPDCSGGIGKRQFYSPAVIYKGSGWYTTDYARKSVNPAGPVDTKNDDTSFAICAVVASVPSLYSTIPSISGAAILIFIPAIYLL